jgi:uncharacterized phage infection (PIP) family protein YhgE
MTATNQALLWDPAQLLVTISVDVEGQTLSNLNALHFATVPWPLMQVRCIDRSRISTPSLEGYDPQLQQQVGQALATMRDIANQRIAAYGELHPAANRNDICADTLLGGVQGLVEHANTAAAGMATLAEVIPDVLAGLDSPSGGSTGMFVSELTDVLNDMITSASNCQAQVQNLAAIIAQQQQAMSDNNGQLQDSAQQVYEDEEKVIDAIKAVRAIINACNEDLSALDGADCLGETFELIAEIGEVIGAFAADGCDPSNASKSAREQYLEQRIQQQQAAVEQYRAQLAELDDVHSTLQHASLATADALGAMDAEIDAINTLAQHLRAHEASLASLKQRLEGYATGSGQAGALASLLQELQALASPHQQTWVQVQKSGRVSISNAFAHVVYS